MLTTRGGTSDSCSLLPKREERVGNRIVPSRWVVLKYLGSLRMKIFNTRGNVLLSFGAGRGRGDLGVFPILRLWEASLFSLETWLCETADLWVNYICC